TTIVGTTSPLAWQPTTTLRRTIQLPMLSRAERIALWLRLAGAPVPAPVSNWALLPGEIANGARLAGAGNDAIDDTFRQMMHRSPGELFTPLVCPYTWSDIVLSANLREHLEEFETQAR